MAQRHTASVPPRVGDEFLDTPQAERSPARSPSHKMPTAPGTPARPAASLPPLTRGPQNRTLHLRCYLTANACLAVRSPSPRSRQSLAATVQNQSTAESPVAPPSPTK